MMWTVETQGTLAGGNRLCASPKTVCGVSAKQTGNNIRPGTILKRRLKTPKTLVEIKACKSSGSQSAFTLATDRKQPQVLHQHRDKKHMWQWGF